MKWKIVILLLSIVILSLLYLQYYNKTINKKFKEGLLIDYNYSNTNYTDNSLTGKPITSVTADPDWNYIASDSENISCDNFCRKVGLTDLNNNCESYNNNIHVRCKNSIGVLTMPSCAKDTIKNKCVVSNS